MQKILIALEVPDTLPAQELAGSVCETLINSHGAVVVTMKVSTLFETVTL